jgi:ABC-type transport system substrate-binding protein
MLLLAPTRDVDKRASTAAAAIEEAAGYLGLPLHAEYVSQDHLRYAVFQDGSYDLAIVGWRLSAYPGYLCDWFGEGNPFRYESSPIISSCQALGSTNDIKTAQGLIFDIQASLAADPWLIPLYADTTYDVYRGIRYPFDQVLDGLSGLYGAPSFAIPTTP